MANGNIDLKALIHDAWEKAMGQQLSSNEKRARAWIEYLGCGFQKRYSNKKYERVFWRSNPENSDLGLNELLFDISVCQIEWVKSIVQGKELPYIAECLWQVESEFNKSNSREITKDFSKLVMGHSENQLFVSSYQDVRQEQVKELCSKMATHCTGNLYLCFVEHPAEWANGPNVPSLFKWEADVWAPH